MFLAVDPGREKCGLALLDDKAVVLSHRIAETKRILAHVNEMLHQRDFKDLDSIVIGQGTAADIVASTLMEEFPDVSLHYVDERKTTLEARDLWLEIGDRDSKLWFLPRFMRMLFAPDELDDYAAIIIAQRWFRDSST